MIAESTPKRTNKAAEILAENVHKLFNADDFKAALRFRRTFQTAYSFRNVWLIWAQCPTATLVAGYSKWKEAGRQVLKGQKALRITVPMTRKGDDGESEVFGFRAASVFDVSQTDGETVPTLPAPQLLQGEPANVKPITRALMSFAKARDIKIETKTIDGGAEGYFSPMDNKIVLRNDRSPFNNLATLIHELAHALMHTDGVRKETYIKELEAESVAFIVCDALGMDTSPFSFAYLAGWGAAGEDSEEEPVDTILDCAQRACSVADEILEQLPQQQPEPDWQLIEENRRDGFLM
ncbi:MAG: ArdC-like ssDNA-binding domain-containing protein [Deinococcota bacterium]